MKPILITGDVIACGGILGSFIHMWPEVVGGIAAGLGGLWYVVQLYDRLVLKRKNHGS